MLSYSQGLINNSNYGIVKTEALFGFGPKDNDRINTSKPIEWLLSHNFAPRSLQGEFLSRAIPYVSKNCDEAVFNAGFVINNGSVVYFKVSVTLFSMQMCKLCKLLGWSAGISIENKVTQNLLKTVQQFTLIIQKV